MNTQIYTDSRGYEWLYRGKGTDDHLMFENGHEHYLIDLARHQLIPEGGYFLDVGAHVGLWSLRLADHCNVYAIEANPNTFAVLMGNIRRNASRLTYKVSATNVAAWDGYATVRMVDEHGMDTGGSTRCVEGEHPDAFCETDACPLDALAITRVDFIKIDVEGAEARVLRGARRLIETNRPTLLIEMHDMYWGAQIRTDVLEFLESLDSYDFNDDLVWGGGYYFLARPIEKVVEWTPEVVHVGE